MRIDEAVGRAADLAAKLEDRRAETEQLRALPETTVHDFVSSGLLRINQAARWGGAELGTEGAVAVISEVAKGDPAAGWVFGLLASHFWLVCLFPEELQQEMWGDDPNALMSSSFVAAESECARVDGGYRIRGRWPFSSGSRHCSWAMVGIVVPPTAEAGGDGVPPHIRWGILPRSDYRVDDDWRTVALRGTGSNTLIVDDAFVPDHRCVDPMDVARGTAPGTAVNPAPIFRLPFGAALAWYLAAPALGSATRTFDDWVAYMGTKRNAFTGEQLARQQPTIIRVGETGAKLDLARLLAAHTPRDIDDAIARGPLDAALRVRAGRDATMAVRLCVEVVETCMQFAGGHALFDSNPIQQGWRDVHGVAAHMGFNTDMAYGGWGHHLLGIPMPPSMFG
ncbi:MAG TPA: acyl-CoA dehydrogenase family protein [Acidimicrobiia bacterium]|nr:acyl-CoA dehydrogenase family protein [Acidimicrobiia bacterium]